MLKKSTTKLAALFVTLCMALTLVPFAAFAEDGDCTHAHDETCGYTEGSLCGHSHDDGCGFAEETLETPCDMGCEGGEHAEGCAYAPAVPGADCGHEHDEDCGFIEAVPCAHEHGEGCGGLDEPTDDTTGSAEEPGEPGTNEPSASDVVITITGEGEYSDALYLDAGVAVTDEMLLAGVSAADESGEAVAVTIADVGGLDRDNPQPKGEPGSPEAYTITYAAGDATATRECFVTAGIMPLANASAFMITYTGGGGEPILYSDYSITMDSFGNILTIHSNKAMTIKNTGTGATSDRIAIYSPAANITLAGVNINTGVSAFDMLAGTEVNLTLEGTNTLKSNFDAGLYAPEGSVLTINGDGELTATGGESGAGIGGSLGDSGGIIVINDGTVTATGGDLGAGIGGGDNNNSPVPNITINGGIVKAKGTNGAGIGGGNMGYGGNITINGGTVTATSTSGVGIGGGLDGDPGTFDLDGDAVVITSSISDTNETNKTLGVLFTGCDIDESGNASGGVGSMYGLGVTIETDAEFPADSTLTVDNSDPQTGPQTLEVADDVVLTNNGALTILVNGELRVRGEFINESGGEIIVSDGGNIDISSMGKFKNDGVIECSGNTLASGNFENNGKITLVDGGFLELNGPFANTASGEITINEGCNFVGYNWFSNNGTINNHGTIYGWNGEGGTLNNVSETGVTITVRETGETASSATARYGDTITLTATAEVKTGSVPRMLRAVEETVDFYLGAVEDGTLLGSVNVTRTPGETKTGGFVTAKLEIPLTDAKWKPGDAPYTITADFGGVAGTIEDIGLFESNSTATLKIEKGERAAPTGLGTTAVTAEGASDGTITNVNLEMQYKRSTEEESAYENVTGTVITGLAPGTYHVRYAGTDYYIFSEPTEVTVAPYTPPVEPPEPVEQPEEPTEKPDSPTRIPSGDDDDDDSDHDPAPIVRPLAPAEKWMTAANWRNPSRELLKFGVRVSAWEVLTGPYYHDSVRNSAVEVRAYFDDPALFTADSYVSGWTSGADVDRVRTLFEKWFTNRIRVIQFDRAGMWEHPVRIAAKVDLAGWDTTQLVFYYYDPKANLYRRLANPAYWIDANGYLRFQTEYAGELIIAEGELEKR